MLGQDTHGNGGGGVGDEGVVIDNRLVVSGAVGRILLMVKGGGQMSGLRVLRVGPSGGLVIRVVNVI